ncbi:hypothetical protein EJC49_15630 [Aquibium carbonis]|uniref:TupA-like ATPgrasp n=1 Tax=Aquibium carbonis TaxID=2495581 RepID=A0A429YW06_9HYPH|nr:ATP-grasp fold amidoligase family protein [Aquibium carbonis]RST85516.1 hypothetical protein EJC49_15630 [Aquibium carbonis]
MYPTPFFDLMPRRPLGEAPACNAYAYATATTAARLFRARLRHWPNAARPVTYNEKMFWRRVFDHDPAFHVYCDKLATKHVFARLRDPIETPKVLWVGQDPKHFPGDLMRPGVIAKMTAGSRQTWFFSTRRDARPAFEKECRDWLARPFGTRHAEWAYLGIERLLFAEEEIAGHRPQMDELKVHLFGGETYYTVIYRDEKTPVSKSAIYDAEGRRLDVQTSAASKDPSRRLPPGHQVPACYGRAIRAAEEIADGTDYLRVDFLVSEGRLYGGEITPYPTAGHMVNSDKAIMADMSRRWDLRRSWFLKTPQVGFKRLCQSRMRAFVEAEQATYARFDGA